MYDIPMYDYVNATVNGERESLYARKRRLRLKADRAIEDEKLLALQLEFSALLNGDDKSPFLRRISMLKQLLKVRILEASFAVCASGREMNADTQRILRKYGLKLTGDRRTDAEKIRFMHEKLVRSLEKDFEQEKGSEERQKPTIATYEEQIAMICTHYNFHASIRTMDAGSFAAYCHRMHKEHEEYEKIRNKTKR